MFPSMFDPNPPHTFDKIVENRLQQKHSQSLTLTPKVTKCVTKCQGHSRNQKLKKMTLGTKNMAPKKLSRGSLSNWCDIESSKTRCHPHPKLRQLFIKLVKYVFMNKILIASVCILHLKEPSFRCF